jgi:hydroxymethylpyrimidine/phosphomethylpyrimidine kinase
MTTFLLPPEHDRKVSDLTDPPSDETAEGELNPPCVLVFNASDPSGAGGLSSDALAMASVGAHMLPVVTGAYARDTAEIFDHFTFDEEAVAEQARAILEDVEVQLIKVGFVGSPENLSTVAETATDYPEVPVVAYMPNLSWWEDTQIEAYLDAFRELVLPQTTVLVGNHSTLWRWLLPDWAGERPPTARDIAKAAGEVGVPYTLVTGLVLPDQFIDNVLASPQSVLASEKYERLDAVFAGAGDTLSGALAALLASGTDLVAATTEALSYMDRCLDAGFRPGMGHVLPDRLFWAQPEDDEDNDDDPASPSDFALPPHDTRH